MDDASRDTDTPNVPKIWALLDKYHKAGFALTELHIIERDGCTCRLKSSAEHYPSAGKHPIRERWQREPLVSWPDIVATWDSSRPWNVGILTGSVSGIWVLDVDPAGGGIETLTELQRIHGPLPTTFMARTGGGGVHYYWRLPGWSAGIAAAVTIRNSASKRAGRGLDVRGDGGYVVAAPSVSAKGSYDVLADVPMVEAPAWLVELVRQPDAPDEKARAREQIGQVGNVAQVGSNGQVALEPVEARRVAAYADSAVRGEIARLAAAPVGTRNETAFAVACNLIEIVNAPWSGWASGSAYSAYVGAVAACELPMAEGVACWSSAAVKVGTAARVLPALPALVGIVEPPPLLSAPASGAGTGLAIGMTGDAVDALLAEFLDSDQLDEITPLLPLIGGYLWRDTIGWLTGQPGSMKSFVALSMACAVAAGHPWMGFPVTQGDVWYMVAEGAHGVRPRLRAWEKTHLNGGRIKHLTFLPRPVQARAGGEWALLVEGARRRAPALIVLDTQARITVGAEENSAKDMGEFVERADELRRASGATVLIVHHLTKDGGSMRGSGAMFGAAQTELLTVKEVRGSRTWVTVHTNKQKDSPELGPLQLVPQPVAGDVEAIDGSLVGVASKGSVVLVSAVQTVSPEQVAIERVEALNTAQAQLAEIMQTTFWQLPGGTKGEIKSEWLTRTGIGKTTFYRVFNDLYDRGLIKRITGTGSYIWTPPDMTVKEDAYYGASSNELGQ